MEAYCRVDDLLTCGLTVHRDQLRAQCSVTSIGNLYLFYAHAVHKMQSVATDVTHTWSVCLSVCLRVGYTDVLFKNIWTEQDAICGAGQTNHAFDGFKIPNGRGYFWGVVTAAVLSSIRDYSVIDDGMQQNGFIQFSITARYAMRPFIKILWPRCCCCCHLLVCCQKRKNCSYFCVHCLCIVGWSSWASSARLFCHHLGRPPHPSEQWCLRSAWEEVIDSGCWH